MKYTLNLKTTSSDRDLSLNMHEFNVSEDFWQIAKNSELKAVFSDVSYSEAILSCENLDKIYSLELYINDDKIGELDSVDSDGNCLKIRINPYNNPRKIIFRDCYGFVQLYVKIIFLDNTQLGLYSEYLAVYFKDNDENRNIQKMAEYVYNNYENYLYDEHIKPDNTIGLKEFKDEKSIDTFIDLIKGVIINYNFTYPFFSANAKSKIIETGQIDNFEKLQAFSCQTLSFMAQNPYELTQLKTNVGIKYKRKYYQPNKTLIIDKNISFDIYENRVVVAFLRLVAKEIDAVENKIDDLIIYMSKKDKNISGYIFSVSYIFQGTSRRLLQKKNELNILLENVVKLYNCYSNILKVKEIILTGAPEPTAIFMQISQYNLVYKSIVRWFMYGKYDLYREEAILPFLVNYQLYEYYVLIKMIKVIKGNNYELKQAYRHQYKIYQGTKYRNTKYSNTFIFSNGTQELTLYYQPVIYGQKYSIENSNGINLYRNSTFRAAIENDDCREGYGDGLYYTPDYLIKIVEDSKEKYLILDAKYSKTDIVIRNYFSDLVFKYLFSISPKNCHDTVYGLNIICGKSNNTGPAIRDAHLITKLLGYDDIKPFAHIMEINEYGEISEDDHHQLMQREIFGK